MNHNHSRPLSDCCKSPIWIKTVWKDWKSDYCSKCEKEIQYALVYKSQYASPGVVELFDGFWWFFTSQVSNWKDVCERGSGVKYVGQVKKLVSTIGLVYNTQDIDRLEDAAHKEFSDHYKLLVKNPQYAMR